MATANPDDVNDGMLQRLQQGDDAASRKPIRSTVSRGERTLAFIEGDAFNSSTW